MFMYQGLGFVVVNTFWSFIHEKDQFSSQVDQGQRSCMLNVPALSCQNANIGLGKLSMCVTVMHLLLPLINPAADRYNNHVSYLQFLTNS